MSPFCMFHLVLVSPNLYLVFLLPFCERWFNPGVASLGLGEVALNKEHESPFWVMKVSFICIRVLVTWGVFMGNSS